VTLDFSSTSLDVAKRSNVEQSIEVVNIKKTEGGGPPETISEIKANAAAYFAAQDRIVTKEDFVVRTLTLPEIFGKPAKVFPKRNGSNPLATDLHILTMDDNGHLTTATANLKKNIKTYLSRYRMITDGINLLDAEILNLKLNFGIVVSGKFNRSEVLGKCLSVAKDYLDTGRMQIGQPIVLSDLSSKLQAVLGVVSVYELRFTNPFGTDGGFDYSGTRFDVRANTSNNIIYCPDDAIFEIKYPNRDIVGVAK